MLTNKKKSVFLGGGFFLSLGSFNILAAIHSFTASWVCTMCHTKCILTPYIPFCLHLESLQGWMKECFMSLSGTTSCQKCGDCLCASFTQFNIFGHNRNINYLFMTVYSTLRNKKYLINIHWTELGLMMKNL